MFTLKEMFLRHRMKSAGTQTFERAVRQIERVQQQTGSPMVIDGNLLAGEAELLSLTSQATAAVEARHGKRLNKIADDKSSIIEQNTVLNAQLDRMDRNEHVVASGHGGAAVSGDTLTLPGMRAEHTALKEQIAADEDAGITRHRHRVKPMWRRVANSILLIDVVALFMLMLTIENTSFTALFKSPEANTAKFITAAGFSLMGALVLAIVAHHVGESMWRVIHRKTKAHNDAENAGEDGNANEHDSRTKKPRNLADLTPVLVVFAIFALGLAAVVAGSIFQRIGIAAGDTAASPLAPWVGAAIGVAATLAPVVVAVVVAMEPSPEVARRNALANRIAREDKRQQRIEESLAANHKRLSNLDVEADRTLTHADRELQDAMLPATQLILKLRTEFGHAGETYQPVRLPSPAGGPVAIGWDNLDRLRTIVPATASAEDRGDEPTGPHPIDAAA